MDLRFYSQLRYHIKCQTHQIKMKLDKEELQFSGLFYTQNLHTTFIDRHFSASHRTCWTWTDGCADLEPRRWGKGKGAWRCLFCDVW